MLPWTTQGDLTTRLPLPQLTLKMDPHNRNYNPPPLKILQWNAQSVRNKIRDLRNIAQNFDLILLTETWLKPEHSFGIPGFFIIRKDREDRTGGSIAIGIRNSLPYSRIKDTGNIPQAIDILGINIPNPTGNIAIYCLYKSPKP